MQQSLENWSLQRAFPSSKFAGHCGLQRSRLILEGSSNIADPEATQQGSFGDRLRPSQTRKPNAYQAQSVVWLTVTWLTRLVDLAENSGKRLPATQQLRAVHPDHLNTKQSVGWPEAE